MELSIQLTKSFRSNKTLDMSKILNNIGIFIILFLGINVFANGQTEYVRGGVFEESKDNPLPGATVIFVNKNNRVINGVITNAEGKFELRRTGEESKIVISFIGLKTQTLEVPNNNYLEIILHPDNMKIEEVEVVADKKPKADFGFVSIDKKELSSAVASIDMDEMKNLPVTSVDQMMQGAAPGLQIISASGDPGAAASIRIRGISSISGISDPLWVIDGAEIIGDKYKVESITDFGFSPIGDIDPSDIESIDILKDASATALYGSKGANGVIVIKTKRGKKGKPQFTFSSKATYTQVPNTIPMMNGDEHRIFSIESYGAGVDDGTYLPQLRGDLTRSDAWEYNNNTDWMDVITRNGFYQQYNTSLTGGGERINYYWGLGYTNQYGTTKGTGYDRFNTRFNLDYKVSDKLKISADLSYVNSLTDKRGQDHPLDLSTDIKPIEFARNMGAYYPVYSKNGLDYFVDREDVVSYTSRYNPLAIIDYSTYLTKANRFMASTVLEYKILKNLELRSQVSVDFRESADDYFIPGYATAALPGEDLYNAGMQTEGYQILLTNNNRLSWFAINEDNHRLTLTAVLNLTSERNNSTSVSYNNGASPDLRASDASAIINSASGTFGTRKNIGMFLQGHYVFKDRYFLTVTGKVEGDSRYGKNNLYSIFPAIGAGWELSKEEFMSSATWVNSIKPRFAFGITGSLPDILNLYDVAYGTATGYLGNTYNYPSKFAYDNIKEERTTEYNSGIDWSLFQNRLSGQFDYYRRTTTDLLLKETLSSTLGYSSQYINFGSVRNSGVELGITGVILKGSKTKLRWKSFFNIARNRNKLLSLPENLDESSFTATKEGYTSKLQVGDVIGGFYGYRALGVYARDEDAALTDAQGNIIYESDDITPKYMRYGSNSGHQFRGGDMIYEDINGDGIINELDKVQIGDANPDFYGGWNNTFNYRNWILSVNFQYQFGNEVINVTRKTVEKMSDSRNQASSVNDRWRKQGDITDIPRAQRLAEWNYDASTRWVEDASYVRLKSVSLTYNFDKDAIKKLKLGLQHASLYFTAYNLYTWTNYLGIDPEVPVKGTVNMFSVDDNATAPPRQFTIGLRASF